MICYGFKKELKRPFERVVESAQQALKQEGFGVVTQVDLKEKFREKLGVDFQNYLILGACLPNVAYQAVCAEPDIGLMLPCNILIYGKENHVVVSVIKPKVIMSMIDNQDLALVASEVERKLKNVFDAIA